MKWNGAKAHCENLGGYLATLTSQAEAQFVHERLYNGSDYLIGGTDQAVEGTWQWVTGEAWGYTNWDTGEPNNCGFSEICGTCMPEDYILVFGDEGLWNDVPGGGPPFICEWDGSVPDVSGCIELKGAPLANRKVILKQKREDKQTTTTDASGHYEFQNVVSGKKFSVIIKGPVVP